MGKKKDKGHHGVFKSSIRIIFEVAQATMHNWNPPPTEGGSQNMYIEIFLDKKKKVGFKCRCKRKKKKKEGKTEQRGRTTTLAEAREMRWRKYNEEQFLMALFTLGNQKMKVAEGEKVTIIAEVFRARGTEENGTKVCAMKGSFKAGVLGQVTLWGESKEQSGEHDEELEGIPHLVLELRPTSSRSFSLEQAQPHSKEETIESIRAEMSIQKNTFRRMGNRRLSGRGSQSFGDLDDGKNQSHRHGRESRHSVISDVADMSGRLFTSFLGSSAHTAGPESANIGSASGADGGFFGRVLSLKPRHSTRPPVTKELSHSPTQVTESSHVGPRFSTSSRVSRRSISAANGGRNIRFSDLANRIGGAAGKEPRQSARVSWSEKMLEESPRPESMKSKFNLLKLLKKRQAKGFDPRQYDTWIPTDWAATWENPWPVEADDLACKHDVIPLMEAEYRRDCVIFFNTLFPRVQNKTFHILRKLALTRAKVGKRTGSTPSKKSSFTSTSPRKMLRALLQPRPSIEEDDSEFDLEVIPAPSVASLETAGGGAGEPQSSETMSPAMRRYLLGPESDLTGFCAKGSIDLLVSLLDDYCPRIMFLKRLYICFACCGVYYNEGGNSIQIGDLWPYPLASVLGHGSRILIRLEDVQGSEFLNFLLTGDPNKVNWKESSMPLPLKARAAATHAVQLQTETGHLLERKLKVSNATDTMQNIMDGLHKKHLGLNMPIGGAGNPSPIGTGHMVGFTGKVIQQVKAKKAKVGCRLCKKVAKKVRRFVRTSPEKQKLREHMASFSSSDAGILETHSGSEADGEADDSDAKSVSTKTKKYSSESEEWRIRGEEAAWRPLPKVQGGHLYIRMDDFGQQVSRHCGADSALTFSTREERNKMLHERFQKGTQPLERAILRRTIESKPNAAGEVFFPQSVPILPRDRPEHAMGSSEHTAVAGESSFPKLLRVSSEPSLLTHAGVDAPPEDIQWVNAVIGRGSSGGAPQSLLPHSAGALRLLLHHYNPLGTYLFGTAHFKSVEDLFLEICEQTCCIFIDKTGALQRYVEPVVLQLRFRGRLLMRTHQRVEGSDVSVQKNTFVTTQLLEDEDWEQGLHDALIEKLGIDADALKETLDGFSRNSENSHAVIEETMVSPSYPGLLCHYRTHMVQWEISEECDLEALGGYGLPVNLARRKTQMHNCDFTTVTEQDGAKKTMYWSWMPEVEARKLQAWVNLGEGTADERWARHAFQREGAVQFPPTEAALTILLERCGIDVSKFGSGNRSLTALWRELTNQEGTLLMQAGQPLLAVEAVLVLVRWRRSSDAPFDILAQVREEHPDGRVNDFTKLLGQRKLKEDSWSSAAMRCVTDRLQVTRQQVTNMLAHRPDDASEYTFVEERQEASTFPGIDTLYRTHLVTYTLREDITHTIAGRAVLGLLKRTDMPVGLASGTRRKEDCNQSMVAAPPPAGNPAGILKKSSTANTLESEDLGDVDIPEERNVQIDIDTPYGERVIKFVWMHEDDSTMQEVVGMNLFGMAKQREEHHRISSVLLGLEGADPGSVSAFGMGHDASGQSSKVSAAGGRKWRAYRANNALQIPADIGGMRMKVNKQMFAEVMDTCQTLDLLDPGLDVLWEQGVSYPRELLNHKLSEKELFKQILAGNGQQANKAIAWMKAYRAKHKTPAQVHAALKLNRPPLRRGTGLQKDRDRAAREPLSARSTNTELEFASYQELPESDPTLPSQPLVRAPFLPAFRARSRSKLRGSFEEAYELSRPSVE